MSVTPLPTRDEIDDERAEDDAAALNGDETGKSLEDLAEEQEEEQISLFGTADSLTLNVGGKKKPTESAVKIKARQEKIQGQFTPDDVVHIVVRVRCDKVEFGYVRDSDGAVVGVKRVHHLSPLHVERADGFQKCVDLVQSIATGEQADLEAIRALAQEVVGLS
jgi:hypothetical protein